MKHLLEHILKEWWIRPLPFTIARDRNLLDFTTLGVRKAVSVVGFRRVGKTYLLFNLAKNLGQEQCAYINFEDERLPKTTRVLTQLLDVLTELKGRQVFTLLLDEIQNIPDWSVWVRRVLDTTPHRIFLSGSSSKLSSFELPTELRGRSITLTVRPLTFGEFLRFKQADLRTLPKPDILNLTREYVVYGGFPEVVLVEEGKKHLIVDEYFQTFIVRDLIERYNVRGEDSLRQVIKLIANSSYYTVSRLAKALQGSDEAVSKGSVSRYITYLQDSFFLYSLHLHTPSVKNRLKAERKPYLVDSFLLSRLSTEFSHNLGRLMEQVVAQTLWARCGNDPSMGLYYWKDNLRHEVDFVIRKQEDVQELLQVCFVSDKSTLPDREMRSLKKARNVFGCDNARVITWDLETEHCVPLYTWLTGPPFAP